MKNKNIHVTTNGPYKVTGGIPLDEEIIDTDRNGQSVGFKKTADYPAQETYYLCRCGKSQNKPFCDNHHSQGFDGTETAAHDRYEDTASLYEGARVDLMDLESLCVVARFCDTAGGIGSLLAEDSAEAEKLAVQEACCCVGGRLTAVTKDGKKIEPSLPQEISVLEDPAASVHGPLWVKGGIEIVDGEGLPYEIRNRVALCRCGKSNNKPFCDASHMSEKTAQ